MTMRTMILSVPEGREQWFRTLFDQFRIKHRTLSDEAAEELMLARLIDEAMEEKGEVSEETVLNLIREIGGEV